MNSPVEVLGQLLELDGHIDPPLQAKALKSCRYYSPPWRFKHDLCYITATVKLIAILYFVLAWGCAANAQDVPQAHGKCAWKVAEKSFN